LAPRNVLTFNPFLALSFYLVVVTLDFNELRALLTAIAQTDIAELTLKSPDFELTVRKGTPTVSAIAPASSSPGDIVSSGFIPASTEVVTMPPTPPQPLTGATRDTATAPPTTATPADPRWVDVKSPMVGTFYQSPAPDEPPYVNVGDRIRVGQTVCIIEAMKLMNEIEAEVSGQVMEILVGNGEPVEFGQPLMRINPG
jgi:acetyl-CoA carboxylase biotin carboxyl carrier protein